jgi:putative DNA methylase
MTAREHFSRRNLPHWFVPGAAVFVTYRLAGTIPVAVLSDLREKWERRLRQPPAEGQSPAELRAHCRKGFFADYDRYLDTPGDIDWLTRPPVAAMVRENLYHHDGAKYHLHAHTVMPNHVHVLLTPLIDEPAGRSVDEAEIGERADSRSPLSAIMHSLKSYTANRANELLGRSGQFWQHESYDHWVRDPDELERIVRYIVHNPVRAGLAARPFEWFWSSAHDRYLRDGDESGWLGSA